jgi:cobalt/nickel transport system ATP-binding protein
MSHHIIEIKNLSYAYPDGKEALKNISLRITHGESVGVAGLNGAGKSTLIMALAGILFPFTGEIRIGEVPLCKKTLPLIRRAVGFVFQDPDDQLFMPTVYEDAVFGPRNIGLPEDEAEKRALEALEATGTLHLKDRPPCRLSGGEKRAAAIASVLSMRPDILVMDEPSSNLDSKARRRLINMLLSFSHTKIIVSHDLDLLTESCGRIIALKDGELIADGPAAQILSDDKILDAAGLERPHALRVCPVCAAKLSPAGKHMAIE